MLRLLNFLTYTRINWHSCGTLCTLFVKPWLMKNNKKVELKLGNISLIPETAALCMDGFAMSFSSLLIHSTGQRYDTQQLGGINLIHTSASNMTSACNHSKTKNYGKMSLLWENVITGFSTINRAITYKLESLN